MDYFNTFCENQVNKYNYYNLKVKIWSTEAIVISLFL